MTSLAERLREAGYVTGFLSNSPVIDLPVFSGHVTGALEDRALFDINTRRVNLTLNVTSRPDFAFFLGFDFAFHVAHDDHDPGLNVRDDMRGGADDKRIFRDDLALENAVHAHRSLERNHALELGSLSQERADAFFVIFIVSGHLSPPAGRSTAQPKPPL